MSRFKKLIVSIVAMYVINRFNPAHFDLFKALGSICAFLMNLKLRDIARSTLLLMLIQIMRPPCQN